MFFQRDMPKTISQDNILKLDVTKRLARQMKWIAGKIAVENQCFSLMILIENGSGLSSSDKLSELITFLNQSYRKHSRSELERGEARINSFPSSSNHKGTLSILKNS